MSRSTHLVKTSRGQYAWHLLFLVAGMLVLIMLICDDESVIRWFMAHRQLDDKTKYYIIAFRLGLLVLAGGCIVLWSLRKTIVNDCRRAVMRWGEIPSLVDSSAIIPVIHPSYIKRILWLLLPIWMAGVTISLIPGYEAWASRLTKESGVFETLTVFCYLFSGLIALKLVLPYFRRNGPMGLRRWWLLGLALGCLFVAGEETNWGQLYFHYKTSAFFSQLNYQNDVSIHNIPFPLLGSYWGNSLSHIIAICGGLLLPFLIWISKFFRRLMLAIEAPLPPWISQACFLVAAIIPQDTVINLQCTNIPSELREITIAIGVAIWLWCTIQNRFKLPAR